MTERRVRIVWTAALTLAWAAPGCAPEPSSAPAGEVPVAGPSAHDDESTQSPVAPAMGEESSGDVDVDVDTQVAAPAISQKYPQLLGEIADQLEAGDWVLYQQVRAEVADGQHVGALVEALSAPDGSLPRVAAVLLEDLLTAASPPAGMTPVTHAALRQLARPALGAIVSDAEASELRPLAIRTLGRFPRGQTQILLFERLALESDPRLRAMTLAALGDNVDASGVGVLQGRFADLTECPEARHAALAARAAHDALPAIDLRSWLADAVAPRALACATAAVESGADPDADLHALTRAFDQPPGPTLVAQVLLSNAPTALKAHVLRVLRAVGDAATAQLLADAAPSLAPEGLDTMAEEVAALLAAP